MPVRTQTYGNPATYEAFEQHARELADRRRGPRPTVVGLKASIRAAGFGLPDGLARQFLNRLRASDPLFARVFPAVPARGLRGTDKVPPRVRQERRYPLFERVALERIAAVPHAITVSSIIAGIRATGAPFGNQDGPPLLARFLERHPQHVGRFSYTPPGYRWQAALPLEAIVVSQRHHRQPWRWQNSPVLSLKAETVDGKVRSRLVCRCSRDGCASRADLQHVPNHPPEFIARQLRGRGWRVDDTVHAATCPACWAARAAAAAANAAADAARQPHHQPHEEEAAPMPPPAEATAADRSLAAGKRNWQMIHLLAENFDEKTKRYREGWDDARIAKECDLSLAHVSRQREDVFGPLGPDPRVAGVRDDLKTLRELFLTEFAALERRIAALAGDAAA